MLLKEIEQVLKFLPAPAIILTAAKPHRIAGLNESFVRLSGKTIKEDLIGMLLSDVYPAQTPAQRQAADHLKRSVENVVLLLAPHEIKCADVGLLKSDQHSVAWNATTYPVFNEAGGLIYIVQSLSEIPQLPVAQQLPNKTEIEIREFQKLAFDLFNFTPVPLFAYDSVSLNIIAANQAAIFEYGYTSEEILALRVQALWLPADYSKMEELLRITVKNRSTNRGNFKFVKKSGEVIDVWIESSPLRSWGDDTRIMMARNVTQTVLLSKVEKLEKEILALNSENNITIEELLLVYVQGIEALLPGMRCSVMQIRNHRMYSWAAPSLPKEYNEAMEGMEIGDQVGSCGTAAFLKQRIIVEDIANDYRWAAYRDIASAADLGASWSQPIISADGTVMATFAMYYADPKAPDANAVNLIERAASLLKIILENRRNVGLLKDATFLMSQGQEMAHFGNWSWNILKDVITWSDTLYEIYGLTREGFEATFPAYLELLHPDDREKVMDSVKYVLETKSDIVFEERIIRPDGELRYLKSWGKLKLNEEGTPVEIIGACLDITESKLIEQELEASTARYSALFHLSPQPMWVYHLNTLRFLDVNEAAIRHYGYNREEFLKMTIMDIRPVEDRNMIEEIIKQIEPGTFHASPSRHLKKSGELILVNIQGNSIAYNGCDARIVTAIDYTEIIKAQDALKASERRFKTLIQEGADIIFILDTHGNYTYASPSAEKGLKLEPGHLIGRNTFEFIYPNDLPQYLKDFGLLEIQQRVEFKPFRYLDVHKNVCWGESIMTDMRDDPAIGGIVVNARNVTARMKNELRVREMLDRYNTVSKATSDTIFDVNIVSGEVVWSRGINEVFGYTGVTATYEWWYDHVHPEDIDRVTAIVQANMDNKEARWFSEYRFRCADGRYKSVLDRGFLLFDDLGKPVRMITAMQDITDSVKHVQDIELRNQRLREIAWDQAHLVRPPLARILGLLPLIEDTGNSAAENQELLDMVRHSALEMDEVIRSIIKKAEKEKRTF